MPRSPFLALQVFCVAVVCGFGLVAFLSWQPHTFSCGDALAATGGDIPSARALALQKVGHLSLDFSYFSAYFSVILLSDVHFDTVLFLKQHASAPSQANAPNANGDSTGSSHMFCKSRGSSSHTFSRDLSSPHFN